MSRPEHHTLLVEDRPEDFAITTRALRTAGLVHPKMRSVDGADALDYLSNLGAYADPARPPHPGIILLDLNMPGTDGREVLAEIQKESHLKIIPVLVPTTFTDERDVLACYREGVNSYMHKPVGLGNCLHAIQSLEDFWFEIVILPRGDQGNE